MQQYYYYDRHHYSGVLCMFKAFGMNAHFM